jgi:hypothetical protein
MRISTNDAQAEKIEMTIKTRKKKTQTECREMDQNPSKDRAMHERDNPSF